MDEDVTEREQLLRRDYHQQPARIHWYELRTYYAGGSVIRVVSGLNLVEVAVQLGLDNTTRFQGWIESGDVAAVSDEQALIWYESNTELWAVVAAPWVLVQQPDDTPLIE